MPDSEALLVVFPDTNFFLECREPDQCPWRQITPASQIRLVVCRSVRRELDRWKNAGRGRKSDRARKISSLLRGVSQAEGESRVLRESGPRITLTLARVVLSLNEPPPELDRSHPDDAIILDIMAQGAADPALCPVLLTDDGYAADTARYVGLRAINLPLDDPDSKQRWRLDPEPDGTQRRISELERRVDALTRQAPDIRASFLNASGAEIERLRIEAVRYPPLEDCQIERLVRRAEEQYPSATAPKPPQPQDAQAHQLLARLDPSVAESLRASMTAFMPWIQPSPEAVRRYEEEDRPAWLERVRHWFGTLHRRLAPERSQAAFIVRLANDGTVPATGLLMRVEAQAGLLLCLAEKHSRVPGPGPIELAVPAPPKLVPGISALGALGQSVRPAPVRLQLPRHERSEARRDPKAIYWRYPGVGLCAGWELECDEFMHQGAPEEFALRVMPEPGGTSRDRGAVQCRVRANNLSQPVVSTLPVEVSWRDGDTMARAEEVFSPVGMLASEGTDDPLDWLPSDA